MNQNDISLSLENKVSNAEGHFKTITKHKLIVMDLCFKIGLWKQGLLHDLSKYTPIEFMTGVYFYKGIKSPNAEEKKLYGYSRAWLHHKGRNRHHFEYYYDLSYEPGAGVVGGRMPLKYVLEMACDRIAACKVYHGDDYKDSDAWDYWVSRYDKVAPTMHPDTRAMLEKILMVLRDQGEKKALAYMRWLLFHPEVYENIGKINNQN